MNQKWSLHCCLFDKECRQFGAPWRVHLNTPWFHAAVALRPGDKFAFVDGHSEWTMFKPY